MDQIPFSILQQTNQAMEYDLIKSFSNLIKSGTYILGEQLESLELTIKTYVGSKYAIGVNSGTDALFLALKALGVGQNDEVITVANSFIATASAIVATGAKPVFVDIDSDLNISCDRITEKINCKTKAILPVHLTGKPANMEAICNIAQAFNIAIVEDAAQALGAKCKNQYVGAIGDVGCFSFHPFKILSALGDGGMVVTNNEAIYHSIKRLRNHGIENGTVSCWGYNSRLDTLQAGLILTKFPSLEEEIECRNYISTLYQKYLSCIVNCPTTNPNDRCAFQTYIIQTSNRNQLQQYLFKQGIETKVHYPIPLHLLPIGRTLGYKKGDLPLTERLSNRILSLPIYSQLSKEKVKFIAQKINDYVMLAKDSYSLPKNVIT